jgi:hypothetical protein
VLLKVDCRRSTMARRSALSFSSRDIFSHSSSELKESDKVRNFGRFTFDFSFRAG